MSTILNTTERKTRDSKFISSISFWGVDYRRQQIQKQWQN